MNPLAGVFKLDQLELDAWLFENALDEFFGVDVLQGRKKNELVLNLKPG